jgi:D-glycero-beta-D-manno-heptose-7-phosphate kinase
MKKILIIGESCLDVFVYCDVKRLAPDVPVPVLQVAKQGISPGMAKNVERNVKALYPSCDLVTNSNWRGITKTRYMHDKTNHAFVRIDRDRPIKHAEVHRISFGKYDLVAVSDYDKGFLTKDDICYICKSHPCVFVDTKKPVGPFLKDAAFIKINNYEYEKSQPIHKSVKDKIICTNNGDPVEYKNKKFPVDKVEVKDSSGAGDSFFAALLVRYAETRDIEESIAFAAARATEVVQHKGVGVIKRLNGKK